MLELSKRRGLPDEEVARIVGGSAESVARRRRSAIDRIDVQLGAADADDRAEVDRELSRLLAASPTDEGPRGPAAPEPVVPSDGSETSSRRTWLIMFIAALVLGFLGAELSTLGR